MVGAATKRAAAGRSAAETNAAAASAAAPGLGTRLRRLLELLDGDVQAAYRDAGLATYRPRYTPVMRTLAGGGATLKAIAERAGSSHSAVSQTAAQMVRVGLVQLRTGRDARERVATLTPAARRLLPRLESLWSDTVAAARGLDAELQVPLAAAVEAAIAALERESFRVRIGAQRSRRTGRG